MYIYQKLLLVTFAIGSSFVLIAMDGETKEAALQRIRRSGYIAELTDLVDDDMIIGNYAIDRIHTDLASKKIGDDFYPWAAAQILAGCNIDPLFENKQKITFSKLCRHLITPLESRHANDTDYTRAKTFLQRALAIKCITISAIEKIQRPATQIPLGQTVFYKLAKQIQEPENPDWSINIHSQPLIHHLAIPALIGFGCGLLTFVAYTWWNKEEDTDTDDEPDNQADEISGSIQQTPA